MTTRTELTLCQPDKVKRLFNKSGHKEGLAEKKEFVTRGYRYSCSRSKKGFFTKLVGEQLGTEITEGDNRRKRQMVGRPLVRISHQGRTDLGSNAAKGGE